MLIFFRLNRNSTIPENSNSVEISRMSLDSAIDVIYKFEIHSSIGEFNIFLIYLTITTYSVISSLNSETLKLGQCNRQLTVKYLQINKYIFMVPKRF